ncbi:MAG TPA: 4'-phosphopantetheinyl transferase superfamily protein, partial [Thermoleophilaceae bacterium]|nr:4'-phosphopantetheinyl transferase superfamily protein [Thermoleophilaceae bacterium]
RAVLRRLLARYTGLAPAAVPLRAGEHGKPGCPAASDLGFNCASSGPVAVYAFGRGVRVGVDVEFRPDGRFEEMPVRRYMTDRERESLDPVRTWVVKEAVAKGVGMGLDLPPFGIEVERLDPDPEVRLTGDWARVDTARWHVRLVGDERRVAALATDAPVELSARRDAVGVEH